MVMKHTRATMGNKAWRRGSTSTSRPIVKANARPVPLMKVVLSVAYMVFAARCSGAGGSVGRRGQTALDAAQELGGLDVDRVIAQHAGAGRLAQAQPQRRLGTQRVESP